MRGWALCVPIFKVVTLPACTHLALLYRAAADACPHQPGNTGGCGSSAHAARAAQDKGRKSINIVAEKVSFQGVTRFEDRRRLPLGVATNFSAYAAKVLTQARGTCCKALHPCRLCGATAPVHPGRLPSPCAGAALTAGLA